MLTRRWFAGCAVCATMKTLASDAQAQQQPPALTTGFATRIIGRTPGPGSSFVTIQAESVTEPAYMIEFHTHPGVESTFLAEGTGTLRVRDQPDRRLLPGDSFIIPVRVPHGFVNGPSRSRLYSTFTVDATQPLSSPARE